MKLVKTIALAFIIFAVSLFLSNTNIARASQPYWLENLAYTDCAGNSIGDLSPAFSPTTLSYTLIVNQAYEFICNKATTPDSVQYEIISGFGAFSPESCTFQISTDVGHFETRSDTSDRLTYDVNMVYKPLCNSNNSLKSLSINHGSLSFNPTTTNYNVMVEQSITDVTITAELADTKSSFVSGYGPTKTLSSMQFGNNVAEIKILAENGEIKTYTINVNRNDARSSDNYLKELQLDYGKIIFNKDTAEYSVEVPYKVSEVELVASASDEKSTVNSVGGNNLVVGDNIITVTITAENGATRIYTIHVNRLAQSAKLSDNNYLKSLTIGGYSVQLSKTNRNYSIKSKNLKSSKVEAKPSDPDAEVIISGEDNFLNGGVIQVSVTAKDGSTRAYKISVEQQPNYFLPVALSVVSLSAIVAASVFIFKHRNARKPDDTDGDNTEPVNAPEPVSPENNVNDANSTTENTNSNIDANI